VNSGVKQEAVYTGLEIGAKGLEMFLH